MESRVAMIDALVKSNEARRPTTFRRMDSTSLFDLARSAALRRVSFSQFRDIVETGPWLDHHLSPRLAHGFPVGQRQRTVTSATWPPTLCIESEIRENLTAIISDQLEVLVPSQEAGDGSDNTPAAFNGNSRHSDNNDGSGSPPLPKQ